MTGYKPFLTTCVSIIVLKYINKITKIEKMILRRVSYKAPSLFREIFTGSVRGQLVTGGIQKDLEKWLMDRLFKEQDVAVVHSGIRALDLILKENGFYNGGKLLLIPSYTASVVVKLLKERKVEYKCLDIAFNNPNISLENLKLNIHEAGGVLVTHLLGFPTSLEIIEYIKQKNILVIEDCAHAHGACFIDGRLCGTVGDYAFYSFDHSKLINGMTGGLVLSEDKSFIQKVRDEESKLPRKSYLEIYKLYLRTSLEEILSFKVILFFLMRFLSNKIIAIKAKNFTEKIFSGRDKVVTNYSRISNIQCKIILDQYINFNAFSERRKNIVRLYKKQLASHFKFLDEEGECSNYYLIIIVSNALKYQKYLNIKGIDTGVESSIMQFTGEKLEDYPNLQKAYRQYLQLPIHHKVSESFVESICVELKYLSSIECLD